MTSDSRLSQEEEGPCRGPLSRWLKGAKRWQAGSDRRRVVFAMAMAAGGIAAGTRLQGATGRPKRPTTRSTLAKVPAKVKEAASKALPRAKWTGASKSVEDGEVTYQLDGEDAAKHYVWVELTADAKVNELQFEIAIEKVPKARHGGVEEEAAPIPGGDDLRGSTRRQSDPL